ncbi:MAG: type II toxin-antitoxin system RelE/ParE family toxin [Bacteroidia bacterium]|nr:type II toxin-antitoxin system RelE/ParE family toxin [Bacteroidia bacterium]
MKVEFLERFSKDLDKLKVKHVKDSVAKTIEKVESSSTLSEISGVKKLAGFKNAYRIRIGDYRIGIFVDGNVVQFARIANRKDIYKLFP